MELSTWHHQSVKEVLRALDTSASGLTALEAHRRGRRKRNRIEPKLKRSPLTLFLKQFSSPLVFLLLVAAAITVVIGQTVDTGVILVVVVLNAAVGFWQERTVEASLASLRQLMAARATVLRGGTRHVVNAETLVPGDVVLIEAGVRVPADLRLVSADGLRLNEAVLTGESSPVAKGTRPLPADTPLPERENLAFAGTSVAAGTGVGVVIAIGSDTAFGEVAMGAIAMPTEPTQLHRQLESLSKLLLAGALTLATLVFLIGIARREPVLEMALTAVAAAVAAIPEGLPAIVTVSLATGVARLARRNVLIRQLSAVSTIGSTTVIACDKTGTLTRNELAAHLMVLNGQHYQLRQSGSSQVRLIGPRGEQLRAPQRSQTLTSLLELAVLANDATIDQEVDSERWRTTGDPLDGALLVLAARANAPLKLIRATHTRQSSIPFRSSRRWMAVSYASASGQRITMKGAPEAVLARCTRSLQGRLTPRERERLLSEAAAISASGYKVVAFAQRLDSHQQPLTVTSIDDLTFVGFVGFTDEPRPDTAMALAKLRRAGVRPIMLTGDHAESARAIATLVRLTGNRPPRVMDEAELLTLNLVEFDAAVRTVDLFARLGPTTKQKIVASLQRQGAVVMVVGDGVNDAPVLGQADVGVAFGTAGADVSRDVADAVLVDTGIASIVPALEEGRTAFANIRRVVTYLVSTNISELALLAGGLLVGLPIPLLPSQLLTINLLSDGITTLPLAVEPSHRHTRMQPPRHPREGIIHEPLALRIALMALWMSAVSLAAFWYRLSVVGTVDDARTLAFALLLSLQIVNVVNCRSLTESFTALDWKHHRLTLLAMGASLALLVGLVSIPSIRAWIHVTTVIPTDWALIGALSVLTLFLGDWLKRLIPLTPAHDVVRSGQLASEELL